MRRFVFWLTTTVTCAAAVLAAGSTPAQAAVECYDIGGITVCAGDYANDGGDGLVGTVDAGDAGASILLPINDYQENRWLFEVKATTPAGDARVLGRDGNDYEQVIAFLPTDDYVVVTKFERLDQNCYYSHTEGVHAGVNPGDADGAYVEAGRHTDYSFGTCGDDVRSHYFVDVNGDRHRVYDIELP